MAARAPVDFRAYPKIKPTPRILATTRRFRDVIGAGLPPSPQSSNWYALVEASGSWDMLANDQYGDCGEAGMLNYARARTTYAGKPLVPTRDDAIRLYSNATGFDPTNPSTDQGTNLSDLMDYCLNNSMVQSRADMLLLAMPLDITNIEELRQAIDLCGGILFGVRFPESWNTSRIWAPTNSPIEGRHCIYSPGFNKSATSGTIFDVITWAEHLEMPQAGAQQNADEAWAVADLDFINAHGKDPQGLLSAEYQRRAALLTS